MYNSYYPNPYYTPQQQQAQMQLQQQQLQQMQQPQQQVSNQNMQNGGFFTVRTEQEAYSYPIGHGTCMTFKVEGKPIVIEKSMGFSQLEAPKVERYRLVKEEVVEQQETEAEEPAWKTEFDTFQRELDDLRKEVQALKTKARPATKKKEEVKDDSE